MAGGTSVASPPRRTRLTASAGPAALTWPALTPTRAGDAPSRSAPRLVADTPRGCFGVRYHGASIEGECPLPLSEFVAMETAYVALQQLDAAARQRALHCLTNALSVSGPLPQAPA